MTSYFFQQLRAAANANQELVREVRDGAHYPGDLWGAFTGLFGLASNELFVVSALRADQTAAADPLAVNAESWQATARPLDAQPCTEDGLYVFRRFHVRADDVDEVVALSREAWTTFEVGDDYAAEPKGLFRPEPDAGGIVKMMLVTWYDGFASWERSRQPAPQAAENFRRRHALTLTTYATATRLVKP